MVEASLKPWRALQEQGRVVECGEATMLRKAEL